MDQAKRPRRSAKEIKELLVLFESSGVSAKQFCADNRISTAVFYKWRERYRTQEEKTDFIPLQVTSSASIALFAEVNGIRIYQAVSASFLKELLP